MANDFIWGRYDDYINYSDDYGEYKMNNSDSDNTTKKLNKIEYNSKRY